MNRPNPETLLQQAKKAEQKEAQGKLKIFLGAAPGVGKTYTMLEEALQKRAHGLDIIVGVVESHGRSEIDAMLKELDIIPKQTQTYRGQAFKELDLDAILKRRPAIVLIDEMAHANIPGLRHAKRWQDIKEILAYGIDVYTTLNVQHIESLNDVVSQIIHTRIKETVPDSMLDIADTIELIDLPPEDLLKRLQEGKVYIPIQAEVAINHFFRKGNLNALRELALRVTAERVREQVLLYRQGLGIKYIWPTTEKLLVCVSSNMQSNKLIRAARRMAARLQVEWIAVHVNPGESDELYANAIQNLRFAEELGAQTKILTGSDVVTEIMSFAREQNISKIILGKYKKPWWRKLFFKQLTHKIIESSDEIDIDLITEQIAINHLKPVIEKKPEGFRLYGIAFGVVFFATLLSLLLIPYINKSHLMLIYLLGMVVIALLGKIKPAIFTVFMSVIAYLFFIKPTLYFNIHDIQYFFILLIMSSITYIVTHLTVLMQREKNAAHSAEKRSFILHSLSRKLAGTRWIDKLLKIGIHFIGETFNSTVLALIADNAHLTIRSAYQTEKKLNEKEYSIAQWVYELGQMAGFGTDTLSFSDALYIPLLATQGTIGVLQVTLTAKKLLTSEQRQLLEACANQLALSLEVDHLQEEAKKSELEMATDRVRSALLHSVAHNLRTPLMASIASANTLITLADELDRIKIKKLGRDLYFELEQVNRLISNLLQITYLETADIKLEKKLHSLRFVMNQILQSSENKWRQRKIEVHIPDTIPKIPFYITLIGEVFINLIDNAIKFSEPDTVIEISAITQENKVIISIKDRGPGIMQDEVAQLFEKFYRGRLITTERGLGLGLAICRIIIEAHNGEIWAENRKEGGAIFRFMLPL